MFWAHAVRLDVPEDAPAAEVRLVAQAVDALLDVVERSILGQLSVAISGAAIRALEKAGETAVLDHMAELAEAQRLELLATPMHGALLPMLPPDEIHRQLDLSDAENERVFGDLYRPRVLWPTELAFSHKVAEVAAARGLVAMLVDELAMRRWPSPWPGREVACVEGMPGFFLLPRSRNVSRALQTEGLGDRQELARYLPSVREGTDTFLITTDDVTPDARIHLALEEVLDLAPSLRVAELLQRFPLTGRVSPLPCSGRTTPDDLARGVPFACWFAPASELQDFQWRLYLGALAAVRGLEQSGRRALPGVRRLRGALDAAGRENWWRAASPDGWAPALVLDVMERLRRRLSDVLPLVPPERATELEELCTAISATARSAHDAIPPGYPPPASRPEPPAATR